MKHSTCRLIVTSIALAISFASVEAQEQSAETRTDESNVIDKIVVTAQRREQNLQDVALSVTAFTEQELVRMGSDSFLDYVTRIPNVAFTSGARASGNVIASIRGIAPSIGGQTTAFYFDETPITSLDSGGGSIGMPDPRVYDVNRIEVLRGPQGTLYGSSSMGGTIKVVTNQPDSTKFSTSFDSSISTTEDGGENFEVSGMANLPIFEDTLALRVVGVYRDLSGFIDAVPPDFSPLNYRDLEFPLSVEQLDTDITWSQLRGRTADINDVTAVGARVAVQWTPTPNLTITPRIWYEDIDEGARTTQFSTLNERENSSVYLEPFNSGFTSYNLLINYDSRFGEILSSSSYLERRYWSSLDLTGFMTGLVGAPLLATDDLRAVQEEWTQEVRFLSDWDSPVQVVLGGIYTNKTRTLSEVIIAQGDPTINPPASVSWGEIPNWASMAGAPFYNGLFVKGPMKDSEQEEFAVFGNLTWRIADAVEVSAGARWFDFEESEFDAADGLLGFPIDSLGSEEQDINPSFDIAYHVTGNHMLYGRVARGFRPGFGFGTLIPDTCNQELMDRGLLTGEGAVQPVKSDALWNYESGFKTSWMDNRFVLNGAVFYMDWEDIQTSVRLDCGFDVVTNAGQASSTGFELEFWAALADGFLLSGGVGYVDAQLEEDNPATGGMKGDPLLDVPSWTGSLTADWSFPVANNNVGYMRGTYSYVGDIKERYTTNRLDRPSYGLFDLRIGVEMGIWDAAFFIENVFDENAILFTTTFGPPAGTVAQGVSRPRTIGFNLRRKM